MSHKIVGREVTCQCQRCWDVFDVTLLDRRGELEVESTIVAAIDSSDTAAPRLVHRPGHCDGECRVISGNRGSLFPKWPSYDPLSRCLTGPEARANHVAGLTLLASEPGPGRPGGAR